MAYNVPAVWVYQQLINAGGAANISPDQPACIVGPANNVVTIDFNSATDKAKSLAATLDTFRTTDPKNNPIDWEIAVNSGSAFAGQVIDDASITATMENALVATYHESAVTFASGSGALVAGDNTIGTSGNNAATQALPWITTVRHINIGDVAVLTQSGTTTTTFVTAATDTSIEVAATVSDGDWELTVYHKFTTQIARPDWDNDTDRLGVGTTSNTFPGGFTPAVPGTNDGYVFAVEKEIRGFGSPMGVYIGYKAARADLVNRVLTFSSVTDLTNQLGATDPTDNPLAYGVSLALANSGGAPVHAIAIDQTLSPLLGHTKALDLAEGQLLYWMVPLTTDPAIQAVYKTHVNAMSQPSSGNWRVALFNQEITDVFYVLGRPDGAPVDGHPGNLVSGQLSGTTILLSEGDVGNVTAGDSVKIWTTGNTYVATDASGAEGAMITLTADPAGVADGQVFFYVDRDAGRQEQAQAVADQSKTWADKRVLNFPGDVRVNTDVSGEVVPGYFLMCAVAGFGSGVPAQQGFTNVTLSGIAGLEHSNFYFTQAQLNLMAEFGTFLYVQNSQDTAPYCRHGLTTDVSVLEYREILKVKNWDYLSYYYKNILSPFIGTWNITPGTLQTIRQTITSASETLLGRSLPKIGPPLLSYNISRLEQDPNSTDAINVDIQVAIVSPNNYTNVYLQI